METQNTNSQVALIASPGMGHLIPVLEFAKVQPMKATIFIIKDKASTQYLQSQTIPDHLHIVELPPPDLSESNKQGMARIVFTIRASLPAIRSAITTMSPPPKTLIVDVFSVDACEIAEELKMTKYVYHTSSALALAYLLYLPILYKENIVGNLMDLKEPIKIPGCKPILPEDVAQPTLERNSESYLLSMEICCRYRMADGILVNSWENLEPITLDALRYNEVLKERLRPPPIFSVGPNVRWPDSHCQSATRLECLKWLDLQPSESVLFVSFGSYGTISADQATELAWGLELSQQRFLWVLRPPSSSDDEYLPDGFLTRTRGMGLVVSEWAPQVEILGHESTGGFLSHCGWNSSLESIVNGVPMIAWPLHADQKMNASMLVEDLGVAVRARVKQINGVVGREEIERMVRFIIKDEEGKKLRSRVEDLKSSAIEALAEGGSSYNALFQVAKEWKLV